MTLSVTLIDNYDSFTWNLVHLIGCQGAEVTVIRNDSVPPEEVVDSAPDAIVLSPGPCTPNEAGICLDLIRLAAPVVPIFGVCLGHQAIGQAFGGTVERAPLPMHGKLSRVVHDGTGVFAGIDGPMQATRYHSLLVRREGLPDMLRANAETEDGLIMGLAHRHLPVHGVQFHPESIASEHGAEMIRAFLEIARGWQAAPHPPAPAGQAALARP